MPNIRFNASKTLRSMIPMVGSQVVQTQIKPCLEELFKDTDTDVKYFAMQALEVC